MFSFPGYGVKKSKADPPPTRMSAKVDSQGPDFRSIKNIREREEAFVAFLSPFIQEANKQVAKQRKKFRKLYKKHSHHKKLNRKHSRWLKSLADSYGLGNASLLEPATWKELSGRVDIVPESLVLAQAALESDWGQSRFAREGNNFFGHHCNRPGCGIIPLRRAEGATYEVECYPSPLDSVRRYIHNINTHAAYERLRTIREEERAKGKKPDGYALAEGLSLYSELGNGYIPILQAMIREHKWGHFDK